MFSTRCLSLLRRAAAQPVRSAVTTRCASSSPVGTGDWLMRGDEDALTTKPPKLESYKDATTDGSTAESRKAFSYAVVGGLGATYAISGKSLVLEFIHSMNPAADVLAMANVEVDLSTIPEGTTVTMKYRGKPLFIRHRTDKEIASSNEVDLGALRDPEVDADRTIKPEWLVVVGVCTHLGCVPVSDAGDYGGWFCPCHGSHYDISGRIRKGPAPLNLEVPPYKFLDDDHLLVGQKD
eukprot:CAMPEP_0177650234 /NCGR_PEP_ID=MMETSP0447-20121125/11828_1 /TAXON_ID=0 /ORGANISM="Stygamoeba regulata, Strain BSH-02190019" /LENGTH=236 /DNA_ID=CAMNT_0019153079 /DNA_START=51 /DNA_END=761 /DNA_ORIENTATION=-